MVEHSLIYNEARDIWYGLYDLILYLALVISLLARDCHLQRHGLVRLGVVRQPDCGEASPAEFMLDTVPMVEHFPYANGTIQAFKIPHTRLSICLYVTFIIGIDEIAEVAPVRVVGKRLGSHLNDTASLTGWFKRSYGDDLCLKW